MTVRYITLNCPACGVAVGENQKNCPSCGVSLVFAMDNSGTSIVQIKTLIKLSRYAEAIQKCNEFLSQGIATADVYFYLCIALLGGKKPFLNARTIIDECIGALECAAQISEDMKIYYLRAYIEYDYFERKYLSRSPNYKFYLNKALELGFTSSDKKQLEELLKIIINI